MPSRKKSLLRLNPQNESENKKHLTASALSELEPHHFDVIVGVDNGLNGGLCAVSGFNGAVISKIRMPNIHEGLRRDGANEIDIREIAEWMTVFKYHNSVLFAIEEPLKHAKSAQAVKSMAYSFGQLMAYALLLPDNVSVFRVPITGLDGWQRRVLGRVPKSKTKEYALNKARELAPDEDWRATTRSKVAHDGIVDAFLLAHFCRELLSNSPLES